MEPRGHWDTGGTCGTRAGVTQRGLAQRKGSALEGVTESSLKSPPHSISGYSFPLIP